ncbi:MAG: F0F1 ATP synthase subunit delta [Spirochaetales bacterium]|nr:F0F1 ATP synthase subunit delta [Spirochaetales bacterium]
MEFDLFTFIAQIVNFLILVALLRIFLYKRVIRAMDEREARIASRLQSAEDKYREAEGEAESYRSRKAELEQQRDQLLDRAREEADRRRRELVEEAEQEVDQSRERWHRSLEQQKERFLDTLRKRSGEQAQRIARRVLEDLAEEDLDQRIGGIFLKRLKNLGERERRELKEKLSDSRSARVASAFDLPDAMQEELRNELERIAGSKVKLSYESAPELIAGVELKVEDKKIGFNLEQYLDDLEQRLNRILDRELAGSHAGT